MFNKAYKIKLYPNFKQKIKIEKNIECVRFIFNQMLEERISIYVKLKNDLEKFYSYKYKTKKDYKKEFSFLKEVLSKVLQQSRIDLEKAYRNYICECGLRINKDLNANKNLKKLVDLEEYSENEHVEILKSKKLQFNFSGSFNEVLTKELEKCA